MSYNIGRSSYRRFLIKTALQRRLVPSPKTVSPVAALSCAPALQSVLCLQRKVQAGCRQPLCRAVLLRRHLPPPSQAPRCSPSPSPVQTSCPVFRIFCGLAPSLPFPTYIWVSCLSFLCPLERFFTSATTYLSFSPTMQ